VSSLDRAFAEWEKATARHLRGHQFLTHGVGVEGLDSGGRRHFNLSNAQVARLTALLAADAAAVKTGEEK
jgi:hypothetical protein